MFIKNMDEILSSAEIKDRLQALREDRGITARMRTHLRWLIVNELRGSPRTQLPQTLSVRARAIGCLLVEWLQSYHCHYTLSVLASELPGLADLPRLAGTGDISKFKEDEVEEILSALDIKSDEIYSNYSTSSDSLLACLFKIVSVWKERLEFKNQDIHLDNDKFDWANKLKEVLTNACVMPAKLPFLYGTLSRWVEKEVEVSIESERKLLRDFLAEQEENVKEQFRNQEEQLRKRLASIEDAFNENREKTEKDLLKKQQQLVDLADEVQRQHHIVINNLDILEAKNKKFEAKKKEFHEKYVKNVQKSESPICSSSSSVDSVELVTAWQKMKQLREETRSARQNMIDNSEAESSVSEESVPQLRHSQTTFPKLHEGCHSDYMHFRQSRIRYGHLLAQGDESLRRPVTITPEMDARKKLLEYSSQLGHLISATRCASIESSPKTIHEIREISNQKKLDVLLKCVRTPEQARTFPIHSPIEKEKEENLPSSSKSILPPLPTVDEILEAQPKGVTQLALDNLSDTSDGEITAGRVSQHSDVFWA